MAICWFYFILLTFMLVWSHSSPPPRIHLLTATAPNRTLGRNRGANVKYYRSKNIPCIFSPDTLCDHALSIIDRNSPFSYSRYIFHSKLSQESSILWHRHGFLSDLILMSGLPSQRKQTIFLNLMVEYCFKNSLTFRRLLSHRYCQTDCLSVDEFTRCGQLTAPFIW